MSSCTVEAFDACSWDVDVPCIPLVFSLDLDIKSHTEINSYLQVPVHNTMKYFEGAGKPLIFDAN